MRLVLGLEAKTHGLELVLDFLDGLDAKVADVQQIVLGELDELADRVDAGALEAVIGADGEVQVLDLLVELGVILLDARGEDGGVLDGLLLVSAVGKQAPALAEVCRLAAGSALMPLFYVLLAVSATFCTRSTAAGAAIPFAVLFLPAFAELLPGALRGALVPLLPASAIHTLSGEARIGSAEHTGALVALAVLAAWALLPAVFAAWRFQRTDV